MSTFHPMSGNATLKPVSTAQVIGRSLGLLRPIWPLALAAIALGAVSGALTIALLAGITRALDAEPVLRGDLLTLAALATGAVAIGFASELCNASLGQRVVASMRRELCRRIVAAPFDHIERLTHARLMAVLTADLDVLSGATLALAPLMVAAATTLGGLGYLFYLAPDLFGMVALALVAGGLVTSYVRRLAIRRIETARDAQDTLHHAFRAVIDGGKEIRLHRIRRERVLEVQLVGAIDAIARLQVQMRGYFGLAEAASGALLFSVILIVLAFGMGASGQTAIAFVIALLYLRAPMEQLVGALPMLGRAQVSLQRVLSAEADLGVAPATDRQSPPEPAQITPIESLSLEGIAFSYPDRPDEPGFALGPIDLSVKAGEIVFITGENGAGKSTLIKILTGLYAPRAGRVTLNGAEIDTVSPDYRAVFSTVFYDFHLFQDVIVPAGTDVREVETVIDLLGLSGKVTVDAQGMLSTTRLSAGQRRRLALLQVFLDRRPVVVLDEWAAEQDPAFRRIFYTTLLPRLAAEGRSLVLITHDDHYFHCADHVWQMSSQGRLVAL